MGAAIPLHQETQLRAARPSAAVAGRATVPLGRYPGLTQPAAYRLPTDPQAFLLLEHLDKVIVVKHGVALLMKPQDLLPHLLVESVISGLPSMPVG